ncbi:MAG: F0F1 ATP synthase subunit epsilon [Deltaproteobacteria bacterium]|nr:F0F1 ATP synthase subunit epsilon [Deltaproteobacteria bacterium]
MRLTIVTPRKEVLSRDVDSVTLPGAVGEMTVLPGHAALMSVLEVGVARWTAGGEMHELALNRGFVEVLNDQVRVMTETCEVGGEIDIERAQKAAERARERLAQASRDAGIDVTRAEYALKRALIRLKVAGTTEH